MKQALVPQELRLAAPSPGQLPVRLQGPWLPAEPEAPPQEFQRKDNARATRQAS
jgi:hypothetical protein